jgi:hypothetical protein
MKKLEQKEIELIQSYLTQEEAKVIIPQYKKNYDEINNLGELDCKSPAECLNDAFTWSNTCEGHHYWHEIHKVLGERYREIVYGTD